MKLVWRLASCTPDKHSTNRAAPKSHNTTTLSRKNIDGFTFTAASHFPKGVLAPEVFLTRQVHHLHLPVINFRICYSWTPRLVLVSAGPFVLDFAL